MKKFMTLLLSVIVVAAMAIAPISAIPEGCTAIDITDQVKFITAVDMYTQQVPVIRDDAIYLDARWEAETNLPGYKAPGSGARVIAIEDLVITQEMKNMLQYDASWYYNDDSQSSGFWSYDMVWANNPTDESDPNYNNGISVLSYKFDVATAGTYELVFVGAAQIKTSNAGDDSKDRGFTFAIDGGEKRQVNISDSPLVFTSDPYTYVSTLDGVANGKDGDPNFYYRTGCVYGITVELTAGEHILQYSHLEYSGDTVTNTSNSSRLNYAGCYVQKYLDDIDLAAYVYPTYVIPETEEETATEAPTETVTEAPTQSVTEAPTQSVTEAEAPAPSSGCTSAIVSGAAIVVVACMAAVALKKKH